MARMSISPEPSGVAVGHRADAAWARCRHRQLLQVRQREQHRVLVPLRRSGSRRGRRRGRRPARPRRPARLVRRRRCGGEEIAASTRRRGRASRRRRRPRPPPPNSDPLAPDARRARSAPLDGATASAAAPVNSSPPPAEARRHVVGARPGRRTREPPTASTSRRSPLSRCTSRPLISPRARRARSPPRAADRPARRRRPGASHRSARPRPPQRAPPRPPRTTMMWLHFLQRILKTLPRTLSSEIEYLVAQESQTIFIYASIQGEQAGPRKRATLY